MWHFCDASGPRIIASPDGQSSLPSVVHIDPRTGTATVGAEARARAVERPMETIYSIKRLMGRSLDEVRPDLRHLTYRVVEAPLCGGARGGCCGRSAPLHAPADLRDDPGRAESAGRKPTSVSLFARAVITVPAYFDDAQRQATRDAAGLPGWSRADRQ